MEQNTNSNYGSLKIVRGDMKKEKRPDWFNKLRGETKIKMPKQSIKEQYKNKEIGNLYSLLKKKIKQE